MDWDEIRIDAGEVSIADLEKFPSWEFCLDEEGLDDQDELTIRPFKLHDESLELKDSCMVATDFVATSGQTFLGWITIGDMTTGDVWDLTPELFLPAEQFDLASANVPKNLSPMLEYADHCRITFCLGDIEHDPLHEARPFMDFVYRLLKLSDRELFPVAIQPRQKINGWNNDLKIEGFHRPPGAPLNARYAR